MTDAPPIYDGPAPARRWMGQHEPRIGNLERGLAVLETIVEKLAASMDAEHRAMKEARREDRAAMKKLGEQMEEAIKSLTAKLEKVAERNAAIDSSLLEGQSQAKGAFAGANWAFNAFVALVGVFLAGGSLLMAYRAGSDRAAPGAAGSHYERQAQ